MDKIRQLTSNELEMATKSNVDRHRTYTLSGMFLSGMPDEVSDNSMSIKDLNGEIMIVCFVKNKNSTLLQQNKKIHIVE